MKVTIKSGGVGEVRADLLAIPITQADPKGRPSLPRGVAALDSKLGGVIKAALQSDDFKGAESDRLVLYPTTSRPTVQRVLLVGLGESGSLNAEKQRHLAATASSIARDRGHTRVAILARPTRALDASGTAAALAEGAVLGAYRYDRYQSKARKAGNKAPQPRSVSLVFDELSGPAAVRQAAARAVIGAESQARARDLSNAPPNEMTPLALAAAARAAAREANLRCRVLRGAELERLGARALLAVGSGSVHPPCLIVLQHPGRGSAAKKKPLALVGKGITFDSGGLSLKPSNSMPEMKHDMSGAAAVIGAMRAIGQLDLAEPVVGVIAAAENMPSGSAYRPGDIVTAASGKTIEVLNTDAEGRVVLADALHYTREKFAPRAIVDLATLTGATMVALGPWGTAAMGNNDALIDSLRAAGDQASERVWPMPLLPEHYRAIKSTVADIKNTGGPSAGASTAGAFLGEFVGDTPWAHLDIAGTGWNSHRTPYHRGGATGVGVRMLLAWIQAGVQRFA